MHKAIVLYSISLYFSTMYSVFFHMLSAMVLAILAAFKTIYYQKPPVSFEKSRRKRKHFLTLSHQFNIILFKGNESEI